MFIQLQDKSIFDPRFIAYAELMNRLQQEHDIHKHTALKIRMEMIGRSEEERLKYNQRSNERQYIDAAYRANGWSSDVVEQSRNAYKAWKELKESEVPEYKQLAEHASVSVLRSIGTAKEDSTLAYDLARYLKQHKKLPPCNTVRAAAQGRTNKDFEFLRGQTSSVPSTTLSTTPIPNEPTINLVDNNTVSVSAEVVNTATPETTTTFKTQQEAIAELVSDDTKPYLNDLSSAGVYHAGGRISSVRACTQHITEMSIMSPEMAKAVDELFHAVISLKGRSPALVDYNDLPIRGRR